MSTPKNCSSAKQRRGDAPRDDRRGDELPVVAAPQDQRRRDREQRVLGELRRGDEVHERARSGRGSRRRAQRMRSRAAVRGARARTRPQALAQGDDATTTTREIRTASMPEVRRAERHAHARLVLDVQEEEGNRECQHERALSAAGVSGVGTRTSLGIAVPRMVAPDAFAALLAPVGGSRWDLRLSSPRLLRHRHSGARVLDPRCSVCTRSSSRRPGSSRRCST